MKMVPMVVERDGKVLMTCAFEQRADGTLWSQGMPLLNAGAPGALAKEQAAALVRAKRWDAIPAAMYAKVGDNPGGLCIRPVVAEAPEQTAAQKARLAIEAILVRAERLEQSASEDNVAGPARLRAEYDAALAEWRASYPEAAREEEREELLEQAAREERLAQDALGYDADGDFGPAEREATAETHRAKARELRESAGRL